MILTTTNSIEGSRIIEYKGIVTGMAYNTTYSPKDQKMKFKDMFNMSKYYESYDKNIEIVKEEAFQKLKDNAKRLNANAIVGVKIDIEPISNTSTIIINITGTAVSIVSEK